MKKEGMLPPSAFAGTPKNKLGPAAHLKGKMKRPARQGDLVGESVIIGPDDTGDWTNPQVAVLGGAGSYTFENLKKKALGEAKQLAEDISKGEYKNSAYNIKQLVNTLNTIVAAEDELSKRHFSEAKQRLDPKCWKGYKKQGTKMKDGVRVNNCVKVSEDWEIELENMIRLLKK